MGFLYNSVSAEAPPNEWEESKKECKLDGKIIYSTFEPSALCVNYYHLIVRDKNYNYYQVTTVENKPYYRDLSGTHAKNISCSGAYEDFGNSLVPKIGENYHFIIRKYYDRDNYVLSYAKEQYKTRTEKENCTWNIIDKVPTQMTKIIPSETIALQKDETNQINSQNYYLFGIIVLLLIIIAFGIRKLYFSK